MGPLVFDPSDIFFLQMIHIIVAFELAYPILSRKRRNPMGQKLKDPWVLLRRP
jgi:hypothetical protein